MSREAFEKWYDKCVADCSVRLGTKAQEWVVWNAGYEAAEPKWIPYKEGDDVAYDTNALVTYEFLPLGCNEYGVTEAWFRGGKWIDNGDEVFEHVTAYMPLPEPYVPEVEE